MKINVQVEDGSAEFVTVEQFVIENHYSESGPCNVCEPKDLQPVVEVGYPPFHPNCVCTVEWRET